jgi:hypothetical protein
MLDNHSGKSLPISATSGSTCLCDYINLWFQREIRLCNPQFSYVYFTFQRVILFSKFGHKFLIQVSLSTGILIPLGMFHPLNWLVVTRNQWQIFISKI